MTRPVDFRSADHVPTDKHQVAAPRAKPVRADARNAGGAAFGAVPGLFDQRPPLRHPHPAGPHDRASALAASAQPKLEVGAAGDPYEQEADRIADQVLILLRRSGPNGGTTGGETAAGTSDTPAVGDEAGRPAARPAAAHVSRRAVPGRIGATGGPVDAGVEQSLNAARGGGVALDEPVRRKMEQAMGADFSAVRLHTGPDAAALNESISAQAFTMGSNIFLRDGMPDTRTEAGQSLLAHELVHTLQQDGGARRDPRPVHRTIQRKKAPALALRVIEDWVKYSAAGGAARSDKLKALDRALARWVNGGRKLPGAIARNLTETNAVIDAIVDWRASKNGPSRRDGAVTALCHELIPEFARIVQASVERAHDEAISAPLYANFQKIDAQTAQFAEKHTADVKQERFWRSRQTPALMANTEKNDDGTLTEAALKKLDKLQIEEADKLKSVAQNATLIVPEGVDRAHIMKAHTNEISTRTEYPELANDATKGTEVTEKFAANVTVTYDPEDKLADERKAALKTALDKLAEKRVPVPQLDVYFPKLSRSITVTSDCKVEPVNGIADAVFHPPAFLAVSSANTGNPKTDRNPDGTLKFLSATIPEQALVNTILHEIGHAAHYTNARGQFYNLNFSRFKKRTDGGGSYQDLVAQTVSVYGAGNPREMVAEVFLGAMIGKEFPPEIWEMYLAFGGLDPRPAPAQAPLPAPADAPNAAPADAS